MAADRRCSRPMRSCAAVVSWLAELSAESVLKLEGVLPAASAKANPLDIGGDARPERYLAALDVLLEDPGVDALLFMHAPTAVASVAQIAAACAPKLASASRPALACWLGATANARGHAVPARRNRRGPNVRPHY